MEIKRKTTKEIKIGSKKIGGNNPILVQSMTKTRITDEVLLKKEIEELKKAGCEIIRIAITDYSSIKTIKKFIKEGLFKDVPLVADIQFDYLLALEAIKAGADCIRINPGNIGIMEKTRTVIEKAKENGTCIRIGINAGSIDKKVLLKNKNNMREALIESALEYIRFFENSNFYNFKISAKVSSVVDSIYVYRVLSEKTNYPLHLGITEAGGDFSGAIKSSVGIGILLNEGIGDTIRVSLTADSVKEVKAAYTILSSLNLRKYGADIISCPTCGRTKTDLNYYVKNVENIIKDIKKPLKIAVMGCIVNGPGEAKEADIGIAFGKEKAALFVRGKVVKRAGESSILELFTEELQKLV